MKKSTLMIVALSVTVLGMAQTPDTLLKADFETDPSTYIQFQVYPSGATNDTNWYNYDVDGLADGSGAGRPGEWFWSAGFADVDSANGVLASNSWTNNSATPVDNILVTKRLDIVDGTAMLYWKSAPFQTPRYLDGYQILISTTSNDQFDFNDTLFRAAEYVALANTNAPNDFASYTFSPPPSASNPLSPFVHGLDSLYLEANIDAQTQAVDSTRWRGILRPFSISLAQYSGQHIYIMFEHLDYDDNLIEIDDILVTGTAPNGVAEHHNEINFGLYPNPAKDQVSVNFDLSEASAVTINIFDATGRLVRSESPGRFTQGRIPVSTEGFAAGLYNVQLVTENGSASSKLVVQ